MYMAGAPASGERNPRPKQSDGDYPERTLRRVIVKELIIALYEEYGISKEKTWRIIMNLQRLQHVGDVMVYLQGENRILVKEGLGPSSKGH